MAGRNITNGDDRDGHVDAGRWHLQVVRFAMRKWIVLAVAAVVGLALLLTGRSRLQSYLTANRARLLSGIEEALGRRVGVDSIEVPIAWGLAVRVTNLRIADDPRFSSEPFLTAGRADVAVRFLPALIGRFEVSRIALDAPAVTVIRRADTYNIASLARSGVPAEADAPAEDGSGRGAAATDSLRLSAPRVSLHLDLGALLERPSGSESPNTQPIGLLLRTADLHMTSAGFFGAGGDGTALLRDVELTGTLAPSAPRRDLRLRIRSRGGEIRHTAYRDLRADLRVDADGASLEQLTLAVFGGSVTASASCDLGGSTLGTCELRSKLARIRVDDLPARRLRPEERLSGRLDAEISLTAAGADRDTLVATLTGAGRFALVDGVLRNINLPERVLQAPPDDPVLTALLSARVRQKYAELLTSSDTRFDHLAGSFTIHDARATSDDLVFVTPYYRVIGKGRLGFDARVDCAATFIASESLTKDMVQDVTLVRFLTNSDGLLEIPFRLQGRLGHLRAKPDADFMAALLRRFLGGQAADSLLGRGGKEKDSRRERGRRRLRDTLERLLAP